jgi:hypothetical protein
VSPAYVDSSALVKLVVREPETDALRRFLATADPLATSILATVEVARAAARISPGSEATVSAVFEGLTVLGFDARLASSAAALSPANLRTLDAIHLATALQLGHELTAFVCYDDRLSTAARDAGLPVVAPA